MTSPSYLDLVILESIRELQTDDDPDLLHTLITMYLDSGGDRIAKIETAARQSDFKTLEVEAHSLKSSSANLGAKSVASICQKLEFNGRDKVGSGNDALITALKQEYGNLEAEMRSLPEMKAKAAKKTA